MSGPVEMVKTQKKENGLQDISSRDLLKTFMVLIF